MTIDEVLAATLAPLVPGIAPNEYTGQELEYAVWNYNILPSVFADSKPEAARYLLQVHWFLPHSVNPAAKRTQICQALRAAGFTYPGVVNASDKDGQHYVFECEYVDGGV